MLFLPAAALCCLCSALLAVSAELIQDLTLTRRVGGKVSFSCRGTEQCYDGWNYVYWYQKRETETFTLILLIDKGNCAIYNSYGHPQKDDFSAVRSQTGCELLIQKVKLIHAASYYCTCWMDQRPYYTFGSGTKLFVTDEPVVKPVVSVYPAAPRVHLEGRSLLLCVASAMFPPVVRFSWRRRKENGALEEVPPAEGEQLQLREAGRTAAILLLHRQESITYKYRCYVHHEGGEVEAPEEQEVKLLCLMYSGLIVKSLLFCCGLSLLLRDQRPSSCCPHAG